MARDKDSPEMFEAFRRARGEQARKMEEAKAAEKRAAAEKKAAEKKPVEPKPVEMKVPEPKPVEVKPVEPKPPEPAPVQVRPVETRPVEPRVRTREVRPSVGAGAPLRKTVPGWLRAFMDSDEVHFLPLGERPQVVFALSYNWLILVIIVFVMSAMLLFFAGQTIGSRSAPAVTKPRVREAVENKTAQKKPVEPKPVEPKPVEPKPVEVYYRVQLLTVQNVAARVRSLDDAAQFLRLQQVPDVIKRVNRRGDKVSLFAGAFGKDQRDAAERLAGRLRLMKLNGRLEFSGAQVVPVQ